MDMKNKKGARHAPLLPPLENRAPRSPALFPLKTRRSPFWLLAPTAFRRKKIRLPHGRGRERTGTFPRHFYGSALVLSLIHILL